MEIPKSWQLDWEIAKNTMGGIADRVGGALLSMAAPPTTVAQNIYGTGTDAVATGLRPALATPRAPVVPTPAAAPTVQPESVAAPQATPIPTGKYGWKGTSESINGQPTLVLGTPGTDGGGIGSFRPGSARVAGSPTTSARFSGSFDQPTGRMIEARSPVYDFGSSSTQTQTPIDFANMSRAERRFALANAKLDQGQQKLNTDAVQTSGVYDLGLRKLAVDQSQIDATAAANAGMPALRAAQAAEAEAKATAGLRLTAAADALKTAQPGTTQYNTALRDYLVLSGQGGALAKDPKEYIQKVAQKDQFGNTVSEKIVRIDPTTNTSVDIQDVTPGAQVRKEFESQIAADPARAKEYAKLKETNPTQYEAIFQQFAASKQKGGK